MNLLQLWEQIEAPENLPNSLRQQVEQSLYFLLYCQQFGHKL